MNWFVKPAIAGGLVVAATGVAAYLISGTYAEGTALHGNLMLAFIVGVLLSQAERRSRP